MTLRELCMLIEIQQEVQDIILENDKQIDFSDISQELEQMKHIDTWESALEQLKKKMEPDEDGLKKLTCQLKSVCTVYDKYMQLGISEEIFVATMKFFSRFLQEHKDKHGSYQYHWTWWATRQISMIEFRIGELEYEMRKDKDGDGLLVDIHIPSDADLSLDKLRDSYVRAKSFIEKYALEYKEAEWVCNSWLLAPTLKEVLPSSSRILQFQKSFIIKSVEEESNGFMDWVYGSKDIPLEELPEKTSLQKKLKPYLQNQGKIGWTLGTLISDPFTNL